MSSQSKKVCLSPDVNEKPTIFLKHGGSEGGGSGRVLENKKRIVGAWSFKMPKNSKLSPVKFLRRLGEKVAGAVRNVSLRRRHSRKVPSSACVRSRSISDPTDIHRAEAVKACIEYMHSSSARERSS